MTEHDVLHRDCGADGCEWCRDLAERDAALAKLAALTAERDEAIEDRRKFFEEATVKVVASRAAYDECQKDFDALKGVVAAAQAREAKLRAALDAAEDGLNQVVVDEASGTTSFELCAAEALKARDAARAALAAPTDETALREFGLRVARATVHATAGRTPQAGDIERLVDAVLRGER